MLFRPFFSFHVPDLIETSFFDGRNDCWTSQPDNPPEEVDSAVNHPIVRKIQQAVIRARKAVTSSMNSNPNIDMTGHSEPDRSSLQLQRSNISSLQTSICSLDESAQDLDGRLILNRSRSLQQTHHLFHSVDSHHNYHHHHRGFSLHRSYPIIGRRSIRVPCGRKATPSISFL